MLKSLKIDGHYVDYSQHNPFEFGVGTTLITGRNGRGKCLATGTLLRNPLTGETRAIESLTQEGIKGFQVMGYTSAMKLEPTPVVAAFPSGRKALFRLTLENGYSVVCSETHPFLTPEGSQELKDLKVGGVVAAPRHLQNPRGVRSGVYLPVLMGALIADGGLTRLGLNNGTATYTKEDPLNQEVVDGYLRNLGMTLQQVPHRCPGHYRVVPITRFNSGQRLRELLVGTGIRLQDYTPNASSVLKGNRGVGPEILRTISASTGDPRFSQLAQEVEDRLGRFRRWVDSWGGLKVGSRGKRIPDLILTADRSSQIEFLQGLFAGDGHVSKVTKGTPRLEYSSASLGLIEDLRYLLLQLGVATRVAYKPVWLKGKKFDSWRLTPAFSSAAWELCRILSGLPHSKKSERILQALQQGRPGLVGGHGVSISDTPPLSLYLSDLQLRSAGMAVIGGRSLTYLEKHPQSREKLQAICHELGSTYGALFDVAYSEVYWTKVVSIIPEGEGETYDIEVGNETHLYALDGVITHNSSVIEMIRFALFGTAALRRPASDYKKLDVELEFTVRDTDYRVSRSPKGAWLFKGDEQIAYGTTPVNGAIVGIFGYGLKVFDIANCCNQNQVMAFSDGMKPTERKALIDQTIGLAAIDELTKELGDEALSFSKELSFLSSRAVAPVEPEKPEPYLPVEDIRAAMADLREQANRRAVLINRLAQPAVIEPSPVDPQLVMLGQSVDPEGVKQQLESINKTLTMASILAGRLGSEPVKPQEPTVVDLLGHSLEDLNRSMEARIRFNDITRRLAKMELPTMTPADTQAARAHLDLWNRFQQKQQLLKQGDTECPHCHGTFPNAHKALEHYQDVPDNVDRPVWTIDHLARQERLQGNVEEHAELTAQATAAHALFIQGDATLLAQWTQAQAESREYDKKLAAYEERLAAYEQDKVALALLNTTALRKQKEELEYDLKMYTDWSAKASRYEADLGLYKADQQARVEFTEALAAIPDPAGDLHNLETLLMRTSAYETAYTNYTKQRGVFEADIAKMSELEASIADLKAGKTALVDLKARIKSHLLPSLNTVASLLLNEMTGGEMSKVELDEAFNITVDGFAIEALSGSGKAVANLALRLGLGQVLTNRVFSVFLGDELDASMDEQRAGYLMACLGRLRSQVSQILVVTHKQLSADHIIQL